MGMLRGETFIFIDIPKEADLDIFKKSFENWMSFVSAKMPNLFQNLQNHLEINYVERTILHDGNFDDVDEEDRTLLKIAIELATTRATTA